MKKSIAAVLLTCVCATAGCAAQNEKPGYFDKKTAASDFSWDESPVLTDKGFEGIEVGSDFDDGRSAAVDGKTVEDMSSDFCQQFGKVRSWTVLSGSGEKVDAVQALADIESTVGLSLGMERDLIRQTYPTSTQRFRPGVEFFQQDVPGSTTIQAYISQGVVSALWVVADDKAPVPEELCAPADEVVASPKVGNGDADEVVEPSASVSEEPPAMDGEGVAGEPEVERPAVEDEAHESYSELRQG